MTGAVDEVVRAAETAGTWLASLAPSRRQAAVLTGVAAALDDDRDALAKLADEETHLGPARLEGELARTTFQLRFMGRVLVSGLFTAPVVDRADPDWPVGPRPDLRRALVPVGPVVVFAAGNFPFAFSVAGGDTAAALAAGCPVIVKAHPGHPKLSRRVGEVVSSALAASGAPDGTFSLLESDADGREALLHPGVKAGAFTGSRAVGRLLFDLAATRPDPIPFFGELGSVNPVVVTPSAARARCDDIAEGFVRSMCGGAGQFCTKPGILLVPSGSGVVEAVARRLSDEHTHPLLSPRTADQFEQRLRQLGSIGALRVAVEGHLCETGAQPALLVGSLADALCALEDVMTECFGPAAVVLTYDALDDVHQLVRAMEGQLTGTVHGTDDDPRSAELVRLLAAKVGRVIWNGWPTGVSVTWAMQHGGPWPATTAPWATSVGAAAITRFLRPVVYQGVPRHMLPFALRDGTDVPAVRDGEWHEGHRAESGGPRWASPSSARGRAARS